MGRSLCDFRRPANGGLQRLARRQMLPRKQALGQFPQLESLPRYSRLTQKYELHPLLRLRLDEMKFVLINGRAARNAQFNLGVGGPRERNPVAGCGMSDPERTTPFANLKENSRDQTHVCQVQA